MVTIDGKSTINILKNTLSLIDPRLIDHGERVAYILYKMLEKTQRYPKNEMDIYFIIGMLHDVGAYKTDEIDEELSFDKRCVWSHSIYGYLYLRYLSPLQKFADILLYHHLDYDKFEVIDYSLKEISMRLSLAEWIDLYLDQHKKGLDRDDLEELRDSRFSGRAMDLFYEADEEYHLIQNLKNGRYKYELARIIKNIRMSGEDCKQYLKLLVYMIDFKTERTVLRNVATNIMAIGICKTFNMPEEEIEKVYYATLVYDLGMLSIPASIIEAPRQLTEKEKKLVQTHVDTTAGILVGNMDPGVIHIALGHHEKLNGSGYPKHLKGKSISLAQRILGVADIVAALTCVTNRRSAMTKEEVIQIISTEAMEGKLCPDVVKAVTKNYDYIMASSHSIIDNALEHYLAIKEQYAIIIKRFDRYNL